MGSADQWQIEAARRVLKQPEPVAPKKVFGICSLSVDDQGVAAHGLLHIQAELDGKAQQEGRYKGFLIKVPASWRELYLRVLKLYWLGHGRESCPKGLESAVSVGRRPPSAALSGWWSGRFRTETTH